MAFRGEHFKRYLEDREDVPEEVRTSWIEGLHDQRQGSYSDGRDRFNLEALSQIVGMDHSVEEDFGNMMLQYVDSTDCPDSVDPQQESCIGVTSNGQDPMFDWQEFNLLPKDRAEQLVAEALERDVCLDFDSASIKMEGSPGFKFWMPTEQDLLEQGVPQENIDRFQGGRVFFTNGLSSSMKLPFLKAIVKVLHGIGIPVGVAECSVVMEGGHPYLHPIDDRADFVEKCVREHLGMFDPAKVVLLAHSMGGAACNDAICNLVGDETLKDPMLFRIATPAPDSSFFADMFLEDFGIFSGKDGKVPPPYIAALQAQAKQPPSNVKQVFMFNPRDIMVRDTFYQLIEQNLGLAFRVGSPFADENGLQTPISDRRMAIRQRLFEVKAQEGDKAFRQALKEQVIAAHNFSGPKDQKDGLRLMTATIMPFLLRPEFIGRGVGFQKYRHTGHRDPLSQIPRPSVFPHL